MFDFAVLVPVEAISQLLQVLRLPQQFDFILKVICISSFTKNSNVIFIVDVADLDVAGSFRTSPNSMESTMCSSMSRPQVATASKSVFCGGGIPASQKVGFNEDDITRAHKMDIVATLQRLRLFSQ